MERIRPKVFQVVLTAAAVLLTSCGGGGGGGGGASSNLAPITDYYTAGLVVRGMEGAVYAGVVDVLAANGTFTGTVVNGSSGTATVTGTKSNVRTSCGTTCVEWTILHSLTIVFNNFKTMGSSTNTEYAMSGTLTYYYYYHAVNLNSSSTISLTSLGTMQTQMIVDGGAWGYSDSISFDADGSASTPLSGWCKAGNGVTYYF